MFEKGRTGLEENKNFLICLDETIIGRYKILEYIASSSFSKAIRCLDLKNNQQVKIYFFYQINFFFIGLY